MILHIYVIEGASEKESASVPCERVPVEGRDRCLFVLLGCVCLNDWGGI